MQKYALGLFLSLLIICSTAAGTLKKDVSDSYVKVQVVDKNHKLISYGSGQVIDLNAGQHVLTAHHVIERALETQPIFRYDIDGKKFEIAKVNKYKVMAGKDNKFYECQIKAYSPYVEDATNVDLAILTPLEKLPYPSAKLFDGKTSDLEIGEDVWYVGNPFDVAGVERSILSNNEYYYPHFGGKYYLFNGNGTYGNSGGGLFVKRNNEYQLISLVTLLAQPHNPKSALCGIQVELLNKFLSPYQIEKLPSPKEQKKNGRK